MTILITGGTGFIGSHLVEYLLDRNHTVRCLVRKTSNTVWLKGLPIEYVYGDLFDDEALRAAVQGVDYVYHSAGVTKAKNEEGYYRGNALGTRNLLAAAARHQPGMKRFVHISSQAAVGPSPTRQPIGEEAPAHPITSYGRSKWQAEVECLNMAASLPITIVRPPVVYGPREKDVYEFFRTMKKGLQPMVGFNEKYVSMIYVSDLVRGIVMAGESKMAIGQTYFLSGKEPHGWKEIGDITRAAMARRAFRVRIPEAGVFIVAAFAEFLALFSQKAALINFEKAREMVQDYWTCDASKAEHDLGFRTEVSLEEGIRKTAAWYNEHRWL